MIARALLVVALALALGGGCTYTTTARGAPAGAELWIDDEPAGEVSPDGEEVEVPVTYLDPAWDLYADDDDQADASGVLERRRLDPFLSAGLLLCSTACASQAMGFGFCLANPSVFVCVLAPLGDLFLLSAFNAMRTSLDNPTWPTVPVMMGCAVVGLLPLALLPYALRVPEELDLGTVTTPVPVVEPPEKEVAY